MQEMWEPACGGEDGDYHGEGPVAVQQPHYQADPPQDYQSELKRKDENISIGL